MMRWVQSFFFYFFFTFDLFRFDSKSTNKQLPPPPLLLPLLILWYYNYTIKKSRKSKFFLWKLHKYSVNPFFYLYIWMMTPFSKKKTIIFIIIDFIFHDSNWNCISYSCDNRKKKQNACIGIGAKYTRFNGTFDNLEWKKKTWPFFFVLSFSTWILWCGKFRFSNIICTYFVRWISNHITSIMYDKTSKKKKPQTSRAFIFNHLYYFNVRRQRKKNRLSSIF